MNLSPTEIFRFAPDDRKAFVNMCAIEILEHTADIGLRIRAERIDALFMEAARGLYGLIVENPESIEPRESVRIELVSEDLEGLFVDWLRELIFRFETDHWLLCEFKVELSADRRGLVADCRGERADWTRHLPDNELKAVTYHRFRLVEGPDGCMAEVIFDI